MVLKLSAFHNAFYNPFENDVKMYGTQAAVYVPPKEKMFENDVKMYGTQAGNS